MSVGSSMRDRKKQGRGLARVSHYFLSGTKPSKEKVTIQVAAKTLDVSKGTIVTYLNKGLLTRIKQGGRIYISLDEVRGLREANRTPQVKSSVSTPGASNRKASVTDEKDVAKQPSASFGLLENERQYLLRCRAALEAQEKQSETLKFQLKKLKRNLEIQASELQGTKVKIRQLERGQQKRRVYFTKATGAHDHDREEIQARLLAVEEQLKHLGRPWWKEVFGHPRLRPELSRKKKLMLVSTLALSAVLILTVWWFNRSPNQLRSALTGETPSGSGTIQATSQARLDSELEHEQSARVVQPPAVPSQTTGAPEPETLRLQTPQPYSSRVEESPSPGKRVSPLPEADQHVVGLTSTPPTYVLRAETLATTWLHLVIDERQELEYLLQPNEKYTWRAMSGFRLRIGNAAGLQLYLNDQPLKALGENGEVVHLQLPDPSLTVISKGGYTKPVIGQ